MNIKEKEVLVKLLVEEVNNKLIIFSNNCSNKVVSKNHQRDNWFTKKTYHFN